MLSNKVVLIAVLFLVNIAWLECNAEVIFIDKFPYRGSLCKLSDGSEGVCDSSCYLNASELERSTFCSYERFDRLVCCKTKDQHAFHPTIEKVCQDQMEALKKEHKQGEESQENSIPHPHMALIGMASPDGIKWNCEGSLIHPSYVLTSGHCILGSKIQPTLAFVGGTEISKGSNQPSVAEYKINEVFVHASYNYSARPYNDIAILRVQRVDSDRNTAMPRPACIWTKKELPSPELLTISYRPKDVTNTSSSSDLKLYEVNATVLEANECNKSYKVEELLPRGITDSQVCAIDTKNLLGICQDNFGSQMLFNDPQAGGQAYLVGIGNFGKPCREGANLVYTRTSSYLDWIEAVLQKAENEVIDQPEY